VRHQVGLSLGAVEALSNGEFKRSALASYERGDRILTVARLQRLAKLYNVPVSQLLGPEDATRSRRTNAEDAGASSASSRPVREGRNQKVTVDLTKLQAGADPECELLRHFLNQIQMKRQDFNGSMISIRGGDVRVIAFIFGIMPDTMRRRFAQLDLLVESRADSF
jgi:transcriptional regulator with XRE-family HTH domain